MVERNSQREADLEVAADLISKYGIEGLEDLLRLLQKREQAVFEDCRILRLWTPAEPVEQGDVKDFWDEELERIFPFHRFRGGGVKK